MDRKLGMWGGEFMGTAVGTLLSAREGTCVGVLVGALEGFAVVMFDGF